MTARDRIGKMEPDNQPSAGHSRRRPPDEDLGQQGPPAAPGTGRELEPLSDTPDSASTLARKLAGSDNSGASSADTSAPTGDQPAGPTVPLSALTAAPPVDPELDLVNLGVRVPRYLAQAVRTQAFLARHSQQDIVLAALRGEQPLSPELIDECRRSATRTR